MYRLAFAVVEAQFLGNLPVRHIQVHQVQVSELHRPWQVPVTPPMLDDPVGNRLAPQPSTSHRGGTAITESALATAEPGALGRAGELRGMRSHDEIPVTNDPPEQQRGGV